MCSRTIGLASGLESATLQTALVSGGDDLINGAVPGAASASWADQRSASDECSARDVDDLMTCGSEATWERGAVAGLCTWSVRGPDDGRPPECFCLTRESLLIQFYF